MCGIVGYTGHTRPARSCWPGCAGWNIAATTARGSRRSTADGWSSARRPGGSGCWRSRCTRSPRPGSCGISHTRWATHGPATDRNAHPHVGGNGEVAVVHNGVIENHATSAARAGGRRVSLPQPDRHRGRRPPDRPRAAATTATCSRPCSEPCRSWRGRTAWPSSARCRPGMIVGARLGSPLVVGVGEGEHFLASDAAGDRAPHARTSPTSRTARSSGSTPDDFEIRHREQGSITPRIDRHRLEARRRRAGRVRPLHAEGDPRAARHRPRRLPRPAPPRRGHRAVRRPEPDGPAAPPGPPGRLRRLRHELARGAGRRVPDRAAGPPAGRGRVRQRVPLPERPARRPHARLRPEPVGRDGRHARGAPRGQAARAPDPGDRATPSAARSPARPTAGSTCTPAPRSASPAPRRSRPR